ncbi:hypothetical protein [Butyrivibrio sp. AE3004]|uniref:hypothetical protein n=1 Tax=Butyrivibrio sp. AE3004 TaxID=1506994 RepID=UPI000A881597|nr:hypothetical protein [Butyrivibrio sp. AE3004]
MSLILKRKFRILICFFIAYLCLVAFSLAATNRAPVRNNESLILTDFASGQEIEDIPYGNHSFRMTIAGSDVIHAPVNLMSGESFHVKFRARLEGVSEAEVVSNLSSGEYDIPICFFSAELVEGDNEIEGDLFFDGVAHPPVAEINIYTTTPGAEITITKPKFIRTESVRIGYLAYTALTLAFVFLVLGCIMLFLDRKQAARELRG